MKSLLKASAFLAVLAVSAPAAAQTVLGVDWKYDANVTSGAVAPVINAPSWFPASGDVVRGLALNPAAGEILIASRQGTNEVHRLNAANGAEIVGNYPNGVYVTTAGEQTHIISRVVCTTDGIVYVCNLATVGTNIFRIYRHGDTTNPGTIAFQGSAPEPVRQGDSMDITGTGNGTILLVGCSGFGSVAKFTTVDGGLTFTRSVVTPTSPAVSGTPHVAWDPSGTDYWFRNTAGTAGGKYVSSTDVGPGSAQVFRAASTLYGPIKIATFDSVLCYALGPGNVSAGNLIIQGEIYNTADITNPTPTALYVSDSVRPAAGMNTNGNGAGMIAMTSNSVYWLVTNNTISKNSLASAARDWNLY